MKRVLVMATKLSDGTSIWRAAGPFSHVQKLMEGEVRFQYHESKETQWHHFTMPDVVVMQRPYTDEHLRMAQMVRDLGKKLWIEYDDNLLKVPPENRTYKLYSDPKVKQNITKLVAMANVVTTTTQALQQMFQLLNPNTIVIPNALDDTVCPPIEHRDYAKMVMWRGSGTHDKDMYEYMNAIQQLAEQHPSWSWVFLGTPFFQVYYQMPGNKTLVLDNVPYPRYFHFLNTMKASIGIVPLFDSPFNRCKSNIAYQELTYAGAVPVVPDWEEWQLPGAVRYKDEAGFFEAVDQLIQNQNYRETLRKAGRKHLMENMVLSRVNLQRVELLRSLLS